MSVETTGVLGVCTGIGCGSATAELANTGNPVLVGLIAGIAMIVALGLITRATQSNR